MITKQRLIIKDRSLVAWWDAHHVAALPDGDAHHVAILVALFIVVLDNYDVVQLFQTLLLLFSLLIMTNLSWIVFIFFKARVLSVVVLLNPPLRELKEDPCIKWVVHRVKLLYELGWLLVAVRNVLLINLVVFDHIAHEVLDDIALPLLKLGLLHEAQNTHVVNHVSHIFLSHQVRPCLPVFQVGYHASLVIGPLTH